jgi:NRPS condensation-like uncharacterized protein
MKYHVEAWDILQNLFEVKKINNHVLHFSAEFSDELNYTWIEQAVNLLADAFPLIRCGFKDTYPHRPVWVDYGYTSDQMVSLIETEDSSSAVQKFLCQELDLGKGPQMKIGVIRKGKTDTICLLMNHMLCDAAGFKEILYTLAQTYTCLENQKQIQIGSMIEDRSVRQILRAHSLRDRMKIYCSKAQLNPHGDQKFDFEGDLSNPFIEIRKISRQQFLLLKSYAKNHQASINDIMMTALLRVLFRFFGDAAPLPCAIDLRRFLPEHKAGGVCNLMSNLCCYVGPDLGDSFESTLFKVKKEMDIQKNNLGCIKNIALLEKLFTVLPYKMAYDLLKKYFSNPPVAFTNIGILDKNRLVFGSSKMTDSYMTGSIKYIPNFQVSLTTFDDQATLCVNLYGTRNDRQIIIDFLDDFMQKLQNID